MSGKGLLLQVVMWATPPGTGNAGYLIYWPILCRVRVTSNRRNARKGVGCGVFDSQLKVRANLSGN